jgi:UDP-N-acetylglucosamine--N-acetylmuramyl-(pentapeptide) pyrophosphoryl-undecaprenol N-acetylglucosamine transferase
MGPCIAVMAGGTGGHVFPALAVAERLRELGADVFWIGTQAGMEARLVPSHGIAMEWIGISGVRGKGLGTLAAAPLRLLRAIAQAGSILRRRRPALVLGMGGFVAGPGGIAARLQGRPLVIQEQNSIPGVTNQWLARIATRTFEAFPGTFPPGRAAVTSGNPVRAEIAALPSPAERLSMRSGPVRLLVIGGSLGAKALNETVPAALAQLAEDQRPLVRHQAGERTLGVARAAYAEQGVTADVTPFIDDMAAAYGWADLIVCRAGALTIAELAAAGLPALLIPYPHAVDDHQVGNARYLVDAAAARMILQRELTPARLAAEMQPLLADPARRLAMAEAARSQARPDATDRIATDCLTLAAA